MAEFDAFVRRSFVPGAIHTFVGAGGKSTAMRTVAGILARSGVSTRMTTTTRVGIDEFAEYPVSIVQTAEQLMEACGGPEPARVIVSAALPAQGKYIGLDPSLFNGLTLGHDTVLLVEGDGSRRRPLKVPTHKEPVIPPGSSRVFALMGASGFGEPIDEDHCYNHDAAFRILPPGARRFDAACLAALAADPAGCRKGVMSGMGFHVLLNQADLAEKRAIGMETLGILTTTYGISGGLISFQQEVIYDLTT